jgi:hypothetical protein
VTRRAYYLCSNGHHPTRPCPAPARIATDTLDAHVWWWLQRVLEDPSRADAWRVVPTRSPEVAETSAKLAEIERRIARLEKVAAGLMTNFALLTGPAAAAAAETLNQTHEALAQERATRDALAAAAAAAAAETPITTLEATDLIANAYVHALSAMHRADPNPAQTDAVVIRTPAGSTQMTVPISWAARRAAMAVLGVSVVVSREEPRWVATMRLAGRTAVIGLPRPDGQGVTRGYMSNPTGRDGRRPA